MSLRRWVACLSLTAFASCGVEPGPVVEEVGPLAVVFTADFPDVYGPIHVDIKGYGQVRVDQESDYTCDAPGALLDAEEITFEALSEMHFFWKEELLREKGQTCLVISLDASTLRTGVIYFTAKDSRKECFPRSVTVWVEGREAPVTGAIQRSGVLIPIEPPFTPGAKEGKIFQATREGKAFSFGAGPRPFALYEYETRDPCGGKGTGSGFTPNEEEIEGIGSETSW